MPAHIFIQDTAESISFANPPGGGSDVNIPERDRQTHGDSLIQLLTDINAENVALRTAHFAAGIPVREGVYLEFRSAMNCDLVVKSLEDIRSRVRLLNVRVTEDEGGSVTHATVYVPARQEGYFIRKINAYINRDSPSGLPQNNNLVNSIESVQMAVLSSFWTDIASTIPFENPVWCEAWLRIIAGDNMDATNLAKEQMIAAFTAVCELLDIDIKDGESLLFPERLVVMIRANRQQLIALIESIDYLAELRIAREAASFWTEQSNIDQLQWAQNLRDRMHIHDSDVIVAVLDTGVNNGHVLLEPVLPDDRLLALNNQWNSADHSGHGSLMAGITVFGDLIKWLETNDPIDITHQLASVKTLPPPGHAANDPQFYGYITQQAISLAEIASPANKHIFCSAVTSDTIKHRGRPTSYSAAIDQITSGQIDERRRLFVVSAGNVWNSQIWTGYPTTNLLEPIQDPGQSWNALTVGAFTEKVSITNPAFNGHSPLAPLRGLSPYSSTSHSWEWRWPMKPDVVFEGGNIRRAPDGTLYENFDDLSVLSTSHRAVQQFDVISATSAATAQASWLAAKIQYLYPTAWPETIKGLIIHSADWPQEIIHQFGYNISKKTDVQRLIRICGYGAPNIDRTLNSRNNAFTLVSQETIQPFKFNDSNAPAVNEMHVYEFPWPREVLLAMGASPVRMRITLCYFIEPGPGEVGWKERYRYASHALRFDVNRPNEPKDDFKKRVNVAEREAGEDVDTNSGSNRWIIGTDNRSVGSVHSDIWQGTAAEIATSNLIGVYPVIGWWRERKHLGKVTAQTRYSLIVSLETPLQDIDIYTPVLAAISTPITVPT